MTVNHPHGIDAPGKESAVYDPATTGFSAQIQTWLTDRVACYVEREPDDIDVDAPLASYGLDSVYAFALCGDIEDEFHLPVEPTLVWDFGTIAAVAGYLAGTLARARS
jgi:acyl carrier protein